MALLDIEKADFVDYVHGSVPLDRLPEYYDELFILRHNRGASREGWFLSMVPLGVLLTRGTAKHTV